MLFARGLSWGEGVKQIRNQESNGFAIFSNANAIRGNCCSESQIASFKVNEVVE